MNKLKAYLLDFKKKIYHFFHIDLFTKKQKEIFDEIQVGDVVFCKMPLSEVELLEVPEGHKARPYLVADKKGSVLVCFPGSHKKWNKVSMSRTLQMKKIVYPYYMSTSGNERKNTSDTFFNLTKLTFVPIENIHSISLHINDHYLTELAIKLQIMANQGSVVYNVKIPTLDLVYPGMVYEYDSEHYYIYSKDKDNLYGYLINDQKNGVMIEYMGKQRYIQYDQKKHIIDDHSYPILFWYDQDVVEKINEMIENEKNKMEEEVLKIPDFIQKYKTGMKFYAPYLDTYFIYLFTYHKMDYGFYEDELKLVRCKDIRFYQKQNEIYPIDELEAILYDFGNYEDPREIEIICTYLSANLYLKMEKEKVETN